MALSAQACYAAIDHALGGSPSTEIDPNMVVNQVQRIVTSGHPWNWLLRTTTLGLTASQNYINLPSDFNQLVGYSSYSGATLLLQLTTLQHIVDLRSSSSTSAGFGYWAAVAYSSAGGAGGAPTPRLEIYPEPSATTASAFTIFYRIDLPAITSDQDFISIPAWLELPFLQLVRAIALGYEEEDQASMQDRIAAIKAGPEWYDALRRDGTVAPSLGQMRGGAVEEMYAEYEIPHVSPLTIPS